jgi:hypothetical protein
MYFEREALMTSASKTVESLILDLLEWVDARDRTYEETIEAWRTSCPRLPVWEEANDNELLLIERINAESFVRVTPQGRALLCQRNRLRA